MAQIILDSNNNLIQGDFDNVTLNNRTKLQTTTTDATTNVYVVPNGTATSAGVSVANNSDLTNASKIVMATNGTTDTQIISGINGTGSYLPLSFYTNNALAMQVDTSANLSFNSGYGSVATAYGCRAWVNFNGTGTVAIRASGNVTSITDNGTGHYTVNFTVAMPDANYSFVAGAQANGIANGPMLDLYGNNTTGSAQFRVFTQASAAMDSPLCTFMAIR